MTRRWLLTLMTLCMVLLMTACGGGGGGGSSAPDQGISIAPSALEFTAAPNGPVPAGQDIQITITSPEAAYVAAAFKGSDPGWLDASNLAGYGPNWALQLAILRTDLPEGTYTTTLLVGILRSDQSVIGYREATVTYRVVAPFSASPSALDFAMVSGASTPSDQTASVAGLGIAWAAAADQNWIKVRTSTGIAPSTFGIGVDPTGLSVGSHSGTITITRTGTSTTRSIPVQFTITSPVLTSSHDTLSFTGLNGPALPPQSLNLALDNGVAVAWTATPGATWITLDKVAGTTPATLSVGVDPSHGPLPSGSRASTLTLTATYAGVPVTKVIPVNLTLTKPTLTVSPGFLEAGGAIGRDLSGQTLNVSLNTGSTTYPWTATKDQPWISLDSVTGNTGSTPIPIHAIWNRGSLPGGTYTGSIQVSATVNGDSLLASIPVTLKMDAHKLLADDDGVAFASMPGLASTTRTLHVRDSLGNAAPWTATSNAHWLSVTPGGTAPSDLVLTADPTGLAADTMHYATVTLASTDSTVENQETIQIGLWVGSTAPAARTSVNTAYTDLILDPIRPYAYVHNGGPDLTVYNIYTCTAVGTLSNLAPTLGRMTISSDGSRLFLADTTNHTLLPITLAGLSKGTPWPLGTTESVNLAFARTNGKRIILAQHGHVFDASDGTDFGYFFSGDNGGKPTLTTSLNGNRFARQDTAWSPSSFTAYSLDFTAIDGGTVLIGNPSYGSGGGFGRDIALSADGLRAYTACGGPDFGAFDISTPGAVAVPLSALPGCAIPNNVEVARDGRIVAGAFAWYDPKDCWIYDPNSHGELMSIKLSGYAKTILEEQLKISSDGLRLIALTDDPTLQFLTAAP